MLPRQPLPTQRRCSARSVLPHRWLMTDQRLGARMSAIVAAMPPRSGVIVRPYAMAAEGRAALIRSIRRTARAKRHLLLIADRRDAGFDGVHAGGPVRGRSGKVGSGLLSLPVHNRAEADHAKRLGADMCLISPVGPTRSHPGAQALGARGFALLSHRLGRLSWIVALGGMTEGRFRQMRHHGAHGWAAIDAWQ